MATGTIKGMGCDLLLEKSTNGTYSVSDISKYKYIMISCAGTNSLINPVLVPTNLFKTLSYVISSYSGTSAGSIIDLYVQAVYVSNTQIRLSFRNGTNCLIYGVN